MEFYKSSNHFRRVLGLNKEYKEAEFQGRRFHRASWRSRNASNQEPSCCIDNYSFVYLFDLWRVFWGRNYPFLSGLFGGTRLEDNG